MLIPTGTQSLGKPISGEVNPWKNQSLEEPVLETQHGKHKLLRKLMPGEASPWRGQLLEEPIPGKAGPWRSQSPEEPIPAEDSPSGLNMAPIGAILYRSLGPNTALKKLHSGLGPCKAITVH
jgi:hypothetical protein